LRFMTDLGQLGEGQIVYRYPYNLDVVKYILIAKKNSDTF
jgi:hypothetical protein